VVDKKDELDSQLDFSLGPVGEEQVDFLELDESALASPAPAPSAPSDEGANPGLEVPGDLGTSSDVTVVLDPGQQTGSDSDIRLRGEATPSAGGETPSVASESPSAEFGGDHVLLEENASVLSEEDSGISLAGDSGISLASDSGISLAEDSGISLEADSGLTLEGDRPSQPTAAAVGAATEQFDELSDVPYRLADMDAGATQQFIDTADSSEVPGLLDQTLITEPAQSFAGKIAGGATVEELEVSEDLDDAVADETDYATEAEEAEEPLDVSDEVFEEAEELTESAGESVAELPTTPARAKPSEPSWGAFVGVSVIVASLLVAANVWLAWEGLSTMWTGDEPSGPASSLISTIAGLM
jgi:hypothetical protein